MSTSNNQTITIWVNHLTHDMCDSNDRYEIVEQTEDTTNEQIQYIEFVLNRSYGAYQHSTEVGRYEEFKFFGKSWEFFVNSSAYQQFISYQARA